MLIIYEKSTRQIQAKFSGDQKIENIYQNNSSALERLSGIYINDEDVPNGNINHYKIINNTIIKMTDEELKSKKIKTSLQKKIEKLEQEITSLYSSLAEMSIISAQQEQQNTDTQNAIAELSLLISNKMEEFYNV